MLLRLSLPPQRQFLRPLSTPWRTVHVYRPKPLCRPYLSVADAFVPERYPKKESKRVKNYIKHGALVEHRRQAWLEAELNLGPGVDGEDVQAQPIRVRRCPSAIPSSKTTRGDLFVDPSEFTLDQHGLRDQSNEELWGNNKHDGSAPRPGAVSKSARKTAALSTSTYPDSSNRDLPQKSSSAQIPTIDSWARPPQAGKNGPLLDWTAESPHLDQPTPTLDRKVQAETRSIKATKHASIPDRHESVHSVIQKHEVASKGDWKIEAEIAERSKKIPMPMASEEEKEEIIWEPDESDSSFSPSKEESQAPRNERIDPILLQTVRRRIFQVNVLRRRTFYANVNPTWPLDEAKRFFNQFGRTLYVKYNKYKPHKSEIAVCYEEAAGFSRAKEAMDARQRQDGVDIKSYRMATVAFSYPDSADLAEGVARLKSVGSEQKVRKGLFVHTRSSSAWRLVNSKEFFNQFGPTQLVDCYYSPEGRAVLSVFYDNPSSLELAKEAMTARLHDGGDVESFHVGDVPSLLQSKEWAILDEGSPGPGSVDGIQPIQRQKTSSAKTTPSKETLETQSTTSTELPVRAEAGQPAREVLYVFPKFTWEPDKAKEYFDQFGRTQMVGYYSESKKRPYSPLRVVYHDQSSLEAAVEALKARRGDGGDIYQVVKGLLANQLRRLLSELLDRGNTRSETVGDRQPSRPDKTASAKEAARPALKKPSPGPAPLHTKVSSKNANAVPRGRLSDDEHAPDWTFLVEETFKSTPREALDDDEQSPDWTFSAEDTPKSSSGEVPPVGAPQRLQGKKERSTGIDAPKAAAAGRRPLENTPGRRAPPKTAEIQFLEKTFVRRVLTLPEAQAAEWSPTLSSVPGGSSVESLQRGGKPTPSHRLPPGDSKLVDRAKGASELDEILQWEIPGSSSADNAMADIDDPARDFFSNRYSPSGSQLNSRSGSSPNSPSDLPSDSPSEFPPGSSSSSQPETPSESPSTSLAVSVQPKERHEASERMQPSSAGPSEDAEVAAVVDELFPQDRIQQKLETDTTEPQDVEDDVEHDSEDDFAPVDIRGRVTELTDPQSPVVVDSRAENGLSLLDELFPEEAKKTISPPPQRVFERNIPRLPLPSESVPQLEQMPKSRPGNKDLERSSSEQQTETVLLLRNASKSLVLDDFKRLVPRGKHVTDWTTQAELLAVIPARDPSDFTRLHHYFLVFSSADSARLFQENANRLHSLAKIHTPTSLLSPLPPPPGLRTKGEDIHTALQTYTLTPTNLRLQLSPIQHDPGSALTRLIQNRGYASLLAPDRTACPGRVLLHIRGEQPTLFALRNYINADGTVRGIPWGLALARFGDAALRQIDLSRTVRENLAVVEPGEHDMRGGGAGTGEDGQWDHVAGRGGQESRSFDVRWLICFESDAEAKRFVRAWDRRVVGEELMGEEWRSGTRGRKRGGKDVRAEWIW
ncbi:hypothetical protein K402DRAFT_465783 [Aulographum hederae CBS 113979]|uniref:RRM domain-containing protein n=1 Tax=Aulographum hederae CBS 113979 TaxID=1176131 RepID=A0A6G1GRR7_9PEZI|nr:hypothetical protein K402DRAFT_465783 [Aulographum hederae CBS 113979]